MAELRAAKVYFLILYFIIPLLQLTVLQGGASIGWKYGTIAKALREVYPGVILPKIDEAN